MVDSSDPSPIPTTGNDTLSGTSADDVLSGFDGNDRLSGGAGYDLFQEGLYTWKSSKGPFIAGHGYDMGRGDDTFDGGLDFDMLSVGGTAAAAVLDLTAGTLTRGTQQDHFLNVELFELGIGDDLVRGAAETIYVDTGDGNDTITGFHGNSILIGGLGRDVLDLRAEAQSLTVALDGNRSSNDADITGFETVLGAPDTRPPSSVAPGQNALSAATRPTH